MNFMTEPNINGYVYRNMSPADRPPVPDENLQFILIYNDKSAILGGSNMTGRYWSGTVWFYNDIKDFDRDKAYVATKTTSGVCDAGYLEEGKFVVGEDSGVLQVFSVTEAPNTQPELQSVGYACQHDDSLLTLSIFSAKKHIVTGGMDCCIKVWDIVELISTYSYVFAHTDIVTSVDVKPTDDSVFVSTSLDGEALLWDVRQSKPAQSVLKRDVGLTAVAWNKVVDHIVAIGSADGFITLIDSRKGGDSVLQESLVHPRAVHKLSFNPNPERSEELASCGDDTGVKVHDVNRDFLLMYKDNSHTDFVRGLAWQGDELLSCSWDNSVIRHAVHSDVQ